MAEEKVTLEEAENFFSDNQWEYGEKYSDCYIESSKSIEVEGKKIVALIVDKLC